MVRCSCCEGSGVVDVEQEDGSWLEETCIECDGLGMVDQRVCGNWQDLAFEREVDRQIDWLREER